MKRAVKSLYKSIDYSNLSIGKKITLVVLTGALLGLGCVGWLGMKSVEESINRTLEERLIIANIVADDIDDEFLQIILYLQNAADSWGISPSEESFKTTAANLIVVYSHLNLVVNTIFLTDRNNAAIYSSPELSNLEIDLSNQLDVIEVIKSGLPKISNLISNIGFGTPGVLISVPINDVNGNVSGALSLFIDVPILTKIILDHEIKVGQTGYMEIIDGNGIILTRTTPANPTLDIEKSDHPVRFVELIEKNESTVRVCHRCHESPSSVEKERDIIAFSPLTVASWGIAIRQEEDEALAPAIRLRYQLMVLGILILFTTSLLIWILAVGIVKPINKLTAAMKEFSSKSLKAVNPVIRKDEIGQLSSAFFTMTKDLIKANREINDSRDLLIRRNRELMFLNNMANTVNQSLNLDGILISATETIKEFTAMSAACFFMRIDDTNSLRLINNFGLPKAFRCKEAGRVKSDCACHQILNQSRSQIVNSIAQCPMLNRDKNDSGIRSFICTPINVKGKTIAVMNIATTNGNELIYNDLNIFDSVAYHIGMAIENSLLYAETKQKEHIRGLLLNKLIDAQEEERKRIARELHDEYGQSLTVMKMDIESMERLILPEQKDLREKIEKNKGMVSYSLESLRRLTLDLRPYALDQLGLIHAIHAYIRRNLESGGINVKLKTRGLNRKLTTQEEISIFRIIQESINNILKHANAKNVDIQIIGKDKSVSIKIQDDGVGFNVDDILKPDIERKSFGLIGIRERAVLMNGNFTIKSKPGEGTCIIVNITVEHTEKDTLPLN